MSALSEYKKKQLRHYTKGELSEMLDKMILLILDGIITYKTRGGYGIDKLHHVTNIETQTPSSFSERFFLLMDILEPSQKYAITFIRNQYPDAEYLFNFLISLYNEEVQMGVSTEKPLPENSN